MSLDVCCEAVQKAGEFKLFLSQAICFWLGHPFLLDVLLPKANSDWFLPRIDRLDSSTICSFLPDSHLPTLNVSVPWLHRHERGGLSMDEGRGDW